VESISLDPNTFIFVMGFDMHRVHLWRSPLACGYWYIFAEYLSKIQKRKQNRWAEQGKGVVGIQREVVIVGVLL
jgi:hypothetical protein